MDDNLDNQHNLLGYLRSKVEGQCKDMQCKTRAVAERSVHPMFELLLYSSMACPDADALILRIKKHEHMEEQIKIELVETLRESVQECYWGANDRRNGSKNP